MREVSPSRAQIPYAGRTVIALSPEHFGAIRRAIALLFALARAAAYQREVDAGASEIERFAPGNFGVFMGYDFHLGPEGPRPGLVNQSGWRGPGGEFLDLKPVQLQNYDFW